MSNIKLHIIQTASRLFYEKGYNSTGINEIIREADIAKATLYSHFKSKEDLLIAYLDARDAELMENIEAFCNAKAEGNDRLIAVLEFLIPFFNQDGFNGCWCIRSLAEVPKENQRIRLKIKRNKEKFLEFIKHLVSENKPDLGLTQQTHLSNQLYLLYEGALTESHLHDAKWPIETSIHLFKTLLKAV